MSYHGCVAVIIHKLSPFDIPLLNMNVIECAKGVILIKNMGTRIRKYITSCISHVYAINFNRNVFLGLQTLSC